jgi:hypothetical protein
MGRTWKVLAVVLALSMAGCSLFMKTNRPDWEPRLAPTCSDKKVAPIVDTAAAGVGVGVAAWGIGCLNRDWGLDQDECTMFTLAPGIATALVFGIPALVGWLRVNKCREVKREHSEWLRPENQGATEKP